MDKRPLFLLAGLLACTAVFAQAYRWVDDEGVVHYSDRPRPGAEIIELSGANVISVRQRERGVRDFSNNDGADEFSYTSIEITTPAAEETLWNIEGVLNVRLATRPTLRPGDRIRVYFDGQPQIVDRLSFELTEVWRGAHNLQAEIVDSGGKLMIRSEPNRFYVQQTSVNN